MFFDRILEIIQIFMPLITVIATAFVCPILWDWWTFHKVRRCCRSLLSHFGKFCRSLGSGTGPSIVREVCFDKDTDVEALISKDKANPAPTDAQNWRLSHSCQFRTALNIARTKASLESGNFYFSRYFLNDSYGELLVVLTVSGNTVDIQAFCRGKWIFPKTKKKSRLQMIKVKFFGYDRSDYSIMLV
jgi:hypothetical protein